MTVGDLKRFLEDLDDDMPIVTPQYNSGYGGLFDSGAAVVKTTATDHGYKDYCDDGDIEVVAVGPRFG